MRLIIQVAYESVMKSELIWSEFKRCSEDLMKNCACSEKEVKNFFDEWTRKMVHARLGEFIKCYNMQQATVVRKRVKGGQSLRDELFCATKKRKVKLVKKKDIVTKTGTNVNTISVVQRSAAAQSRLTKPVNNNTGLGLTPVRKSKRTCKSRKLDLYEYD